MTIHSTGVILTGKQLVKTLLGAILLLTVGLCFLSCKPISLKRHFINRFDLVYRHNVHVNKVDSLSPLSVGNGDFAFTVDVTGLQTFEHFYYTNGIPLETLSDWAWHSFPNTDHLTLEQAYKEYPVHGRRIAYASLQDSPAGDYFRKNPHRIPLGQLGLDLHKANGQSVEPNDLHHIQQTLDLWTGIIDSHYEIDGIPIEVETVCHPDRDLIAVHIRSSLLGHQIKPRIRFPYAYDLRIKNKPPFDWNHQDRHQTHIIGTAKHHVVLERSLDTSRYYVTLDWQGQANLQQPGPHEFAIEPQDTNTLSLVCAFTDKPSDTPLPSFDAVKEASREAWKHYWTTGGAIDFSGSTDPRTFELERRVILSQYLLRIQYAGRFPPQESGLTHISWYGKHNSEMVWWHTAHFAQWGHVDLLEKNLAWYQTILPQARALAQAQGFAGARWPKMTGPEGRPSPGTINPFIIWNQPHPIYLSELIYRAKPTQATLEQYKDLVFASAEYLASYAFFNQQEGRYTLGPPIRSVSESYAENSTRNPTFELAYWHYGLSIAQTWRERLGLSRDPQWDDVLNKLSPLPTKDGLYLDIETDPNCFKRRRVSSSMLMALGFLPEGSMVDKDTMDRTFQKVIELNGRNSFVSWSSGKGAMTAARLGHPDIAVDILCNTREQNRYLPNGLVRRPKEPRNCPAYLPVNASLLSAVALMAAGWDGAPDVHAPGFPQDGSWVVRWEGLQPLP